MAVAPSPPDQPQRGRRLSRSLAAVVPSLTRPTLAAMALGLLLAACGGGSPTGPRSPMRPRQPVGRVAGTSSGQAMGPLLAHVLPGTRLITAVDLDAARRELGLPSDQGLLLPSAGGAASGPRGDGSRGQAVYTLTQLASLALPLIDDRALLAALDLRRVHAAVEFGGVEHGGLLIATSQPPPAIAAALRRAGWRAVDGGFEYAGGGSAGLLRGSKVALFPGGLVLAADPDDANAAAAQKAAPSDDRRLLDLLARSRAPARFAAVHTSCLRGILADERLVPHVGTISLRPSRSPMLSDVVLTPGDPALADLGLVASAPVVRKGRVIVQMRYRNRAAAAGTVVDLARTEPVYRCD